MNVDSKVSQSCRSCGCKKLFTLVNLGMSPFSNSYIMPINLNKSECFYPLHAVVCEECFLVQIDEFLKPDRIFSDYVYFSSYSNTWLDHCKSYVDMVIDRFNLTTNSRVVEIASNDGYLLQYFIKKKIPCLGVEPAENVANIAIKKGIPTEKAFFGAAFAKELAKKNGTTNLILANNVLAHVPDINDFVLGLKLLLSEDGVITIEFPHLLKLVQENQFDTIYHEHFSYLSLYFVEKIFFFSNQGYLSLSWSLQNVFTFINYRIFYFYFDNTNFTNLLTLSLVNNFFNIYIENLFTNLLFLFFFIFFFVFFSYSKKNNYKFI